jgi:hypothetical protein
MNTQPADTHARVQSVVPDRAEQDKVQPLPALAR